MFQFHFLTVNRSAVGAQGATAFRGGLICGLCGKFTVCDLELLLRVQQHGLPRGLAWMKLN